MKKGLHLVHPGFHNSCGGGWKNRKNHMTRVKVQIESYHQHGKISSKSTRKIIMEGHAFFVCLSSSTHGKCWSSKCYLSIFFPFVYHMSIQAWSGRMLGTSNFISFPLCRQEKHTETYPSGFPCGIQY